MTHEGKTGVASEQSTIDFAELPLPERAELATMSVSYGVGTAAIAGANHIEPTCYRQDALDVGHHSSQYHKKRKNRASQITVL